MEHLTVEPNGVSMETKRLRLKRDLNSLVAVEPVRNELGRESGVVFETRSDDLVPDVMSVLVDHHALLVDGGPMRSGTYHAIIMDE